MFDLAFSSPGDLIVAGNGDLAGISGTDLLEQRIRLRLTMHRDSWVYDATSTLGSLLYKLIGMSPEQADSVVEPYVRDALRPMADEITVDQVWHSVEQINDMTPRGITIVVLYRVVASSESIGGEVEQQLAISLPLGGV